LAQVLRAGPTSRAMHISMAPLPAKPPRIPEVSFGDAAASEASRDLPQEPLHEMCALLRRHHKGVLSRFDAWIAREELLMQGLCAQANARTEFVNLQATQQPSRWGNDAQELFQGPQEEQGRLEEGSELAVPVSPGSNGSNSTRRTPLFKSSSLLEDNNNAKLHSAKSTIATWWKLPYKSKEVVVSNSWQQQVQDLMSSLRAQTFFLVVILINAIFIGVETDYEALHLQEPRPIIFFVGQYICAAIFLIELVLNIYAQRWSFFWSEQWIWNYFDLALVLFSAVEIMLDIVGALSGSDPAGASNLSTARILRILRITRAVRVLRITRIVRFVRALRILFHSIASTLKSLVWTLVLLLMIVYVFGILFTQAATQFLGEQVPSADLEKDLQDYWGTLPRSMLSLFKSFTGGIDYHVVLSPLSSLHSIWTALFIAFIVFVTFAVLNVITGAFCQGALEGQQNDKELMISDVLFQRKAEIEKLTGMFEWMFKTIDADQSGDVSVEEFQKYIADESVQRLMASLELESADAWTLFHLLDEDGSGQVDAEEFMIGCLKLKGTAKAIDVARMMADQRKVKRSLGRFMCFVEEQFDALRSDLGPLLNLAQR